ncbi:MFS transporter [Nocardioides marmorisolisilvae]|uniref:MFS transporter n=1 Tax=Nocardioides marmorisolisilvae TaxID=1542737 RepID=A0A3N0DQ89_9ACTN|nr:MFS transporter [Nocardioides marmorisolisilvae]RNL77808.1 MFS transporter [Nocardioides marmorisolisilvae]
MKNSPSQARSTNLTLLAMCLSLVLVVASVSALNLALPDVAIDLGASNAALTWIADGYTVALAALVLPLGALGDRWGRRNILIVGTVVFGVASLIASFADSSGELIVWRVVMGLGAAMIMPGTLSTITAAFPAEQRARGVAVWSGFAAAGAIIGMLAAGSLLEQWTWRSIFVASAVVAVIAGLAALVWAPNTRDEDQGRPDFAGALLSSVAIGTLVYAIIEGNDKGWTEPAVVVTGVIALLGFAGYAFLGARNDEPLLDPRLFGIPGFRSGAITVLVQFMAVFGFFFVGLQYLQLLLGYSPLKAAIALVPVALVVMPTARVTPWLVERLGTNVVMSGGLVLLAGGLFWVARLDVDSGYLPFLGGIIVAGLGIGLCSSTGTSAIVGSLSTGQQGVASAVNDATREVGSAVGIAIMGSVFGRVYADKLSDLSQLPAAVRGAVEDSPAAGLHVAEQLGGPESAGLAHAVQTAFIDGLSASILVICAILVVAAAGAALRAPKRGQDPGRK